MPPLSASVAEAADPVATTVESQRGVGHDVEEVGQEERDVLSARGDTSAVREAARSGVPEREPLPRTPEAAGVHGRVRAPYRPGGGRSTRVGWKSMVGALLHREGLYSSYLTAWPRERDEGKLAGLSPKKRGPKATRTRSPTRSRGSSATRPRDAGTRQRQHGHRRPAKGCCAVGETMQEPTEEDFAQAQGRFRPPLDVPR